MTRETSAFPLCVMAAALLLVLMSTTAYAQIIPPGRCQASFPSGYAYDFRAASTLQEMERPAADGTNYVFAPCGEVESVYCQGPGGQTACQLQGGYGYGTGDLNKGNALSERPKAGTGFFIEFTGGLDGRRSNIEFVCDSAMEEGEALFECLNPVENPPLTYNFRFTSRFGCPVSWPESSGGGDDKKGLAGGWIFIIVLSCVVVVYLVGGVAYQKFRKEESGLNLIPNLEFWKALPGYVKDGCVFSFNKGKAGVDRLRGKSYDTV
ncbi:Autophagy-related protein 27 [Balamuthia mandrillaris]